MKISKIHLKNFKRFTDLTIDRIPLSTKLVLMIGSNGSGKSSLFDAFGYLTSLSKNENLSEKNINYFKKDTKKAFHISLDFDDKSVDISSDFLNTLSPISLYGRTSFRQVSRLTRTALGQAGNVDLAKDSDRPIFFIDRDERFENDIEKITETILNEIFKQESSSESVKRKYIDPINKALENIFGNQNGTKLELLKIIPPLEGKVADITFKKGMSEIHYNFLSAGEKEVFNLLINLISRASFYTDTVYYLDEMDLHLNTKIQYTLIKEITENWIPENCQLWTASHSLGFIEYAKNNGNAVIIDFDDLDFDSEKFLFPEHKNNPEIYEIAVGKDILPSLFNGMNLYFVENKDRDYYSLLDIPKTIFISENNRNSVYHKVKSNDGFFGIVDRDFLSDSDIVEIKKEYVNLVVLDYYCIENYLYHPDNLAEYFNRASFDIQNYINEIIFEKNNYKDSIVSSLALKRTEYPYFGEPKFNDHANQSRFKNKKENFVQSELIAQNLSSDVFIDFYKHFSMKTYCTQLKYRQNISKTDLAKTKWFSSKIKNLLQ